ncbi:MAG: acyl-CoA/acyl-ACP dehydrogenase [Chrysiogenetes bacterium]|nr:acyl-CoA/acyl-ACP dehydrogenase [Chrysiogenetes bacterium]
MTYDADAWSSAEEPSFTELYPTFAYLKQFKREEVEQMETLFHRARRFRKQHIDPNTLKVDRKVMGDSTYVANDVLEAACKAGIFGMMIPKMLGGEGFPFGASMVAMEEIAVGCLGLGNLLGVHGLALCTVAATGDLAKMSHIAGMLARSERKGRLRLLSTAITEPTAGTDVEDVEFLKTARLMCEAKPVQGGYKLNGRKVFISNGSVAHTHVVIMSTDKTRAAETQWAFLVETGTPGFSIGRVEKKMGQKACPAAELVFEDCFIPESARIGTRPVAGRSVDLVLGATRGAVGLWGAAAARSAFQRALVYAKSHKLRGKWLIDHQWVQFKLTDMHRNAQMARAMFMDASLSNEMFGLSSLMGGMQRAQQIQNMIPKAVYDRINLPKLLDRPAVRERGRGAIDGISAYNANLSCAFGAAAKFSGTDLGMANAHLALDIMGADGLRHDRGGEKVFRDAKLLQIYEGTNQLNRLEVFKRAIARNAA